MYRPRRDTDKARYRPFPFCLNLLMRPDTDPPISHSLSHDWFAKIKIVCPLKLANHRENHFLFTQLTETSAGKTTPSINHPFCNLFTPPHKSLRQNHPAETFWSLDLRCSPYCLKITYLLTWLTSVFDINHTKSEQTIE